MYAFLLLCLPCVCVFCMLTDKQFPLKSMVPPALMGLISAIVVCVVRGFFIIYTHVWTGSPAESFAYLLLRDTIVPSAVLYALFLVLSKDSWDYKAAAFLPLLGSFHAVYVPYLVLSGTDGERISLFMLTVKPLLIASLVVCASALLRKASALLPQKKTAAGALCLAGAVLCHAVPPAAEALWHYRMLLPVWILLSVLEAGAAAAAMIALRKPCADTSTQPEA